MTWIKGYVRSPRQILLGFLAKKFPAVNKKGYEMPLDIQFYADPLPAMKQTGELVDEEGKKHPVYSPIAGNDNVLVFVAAQGDGLALYDELEKIDGVSVHKGATVEEMKKLYPEHCIGTVQHSK